MSGHPDAEQARRLVADPRLLGVEARPVLDKLADALDASAGQVVELREALLNGRRVVMQLSDSLDHPWLDEVDAALSAAGTEAETT